MKDKERRRKWEAERGRERGILIERDIDRERVLETEQIKREGRRNI